MDFFSNKYFIPNFFFQFHFQYYKFPIFLFVYFLIYQRNLNGNGLINYFFNKILGSSSDLIMVTDITLWI